METKPPTIREQSKKRLVQVFCEDLELFHVVAFVCLAFNAVVAMYMSRDSPWDLGSIITSCAGLIWQFWCLKWNLVIMSQSQGADAPHRWIWDMFKVVLWAATIFLGTSFAARVSQAEPPLCLRLVVWCTSAYVTVAGIYSSFLIFRNRKDVEGVNKKSDSTVEKEKGKEHQSAHDLQSIPLEKV